MAKCFFNASDYAINSPLIPLGLVFRSKVPSNGPLITANGPIVFNEIRTTVLDGSVQTAASVDIGADRIFVPLSEQTSSSSPYTGQQWSSQTAYLSGMDSWDFESSSGTPVEGLLVYSGKGGVAAPRFFCREYTLTDGTFNKELISLVVSNLGVLTISVAILNYLANGNYSSTPLAFTEITPPSGVAVPNWDSNRLAAVRLTLQENQVTCKVWQAASPAFPEASEGDATVFTFDLATLYSSEITGELVGVPERMALAVEINRPLLSFGFATEGDTVTSYPTPSATLAPPSNVNVSNISNTSARVSWDE